MRSKFLGIFISVVSLCASITPTLSAGMDAKFSKFYGILDLMVMDEREYDPNRDKTIIGYVNPLKIFKSLEDCEKALISTKYAGNVWEIERTRNPHRDGELRLHQYRYDGTRRVINLVRFCSQLIAPAK